MLAPETDYCLPGSRFARIMQLARAGASDRIFRRRIPGITQDVIDVARRIAGGTISGGANCRSALQEDEPGVLAG